ncbi:small acid-soluble spore protein O [Texcoconibacillus texcoconensis]|uniref:Small acid-soluble spore protein O n=1 Tax=Texcoconibacillus texcoconensis TaxID=1095777 RepID=A0A840QT27_9BACI|nr:small acid-soluble spore protein O [Texcoconibacillus texcoconensis]MBB5174459.1 small acid-soluble spore protein O [Texcoconibacillus texcoconensis]
MINRRGSSHVRPGMNQASSQGQGNGYNHGENRQHGRTGTEWAFNKKTKKRQ